MVIRNYRERKDVLLNVGLSKTLGIIKMVL